MKIAKFLDNDYELMCLADSDILWDEIDSIESIGHHETYDVSMYKDPNFVVDNFITHNTNIMLNVALNVWQTGYNVLIVPIEMRKESTYDRAIARQARVDSMKIKDPSVLSVEERDRIAVAINEWNNFGKFFLILRKSYCTTSYPAQYHI